MEKQIKVNNLTVNYKEIGQGNPLVLLHGWGCDLGIFSKVQEYFSQFFRVISVDLPGFGKSDEPKTAWNIFRYADFISDFFEILKIKNPIILAHSFGGRIAIILANKIIMNKIILTGGAGIKPKRKLKYYLKIYSYKTIKKILLLPGIRKYGKNILQKYRNKSGSADYKNASPIMKQILINTVNQDLRHLLPKITIPTLLLWGDKDTATPLQDAQLMEKLIPDSGLVVLNGGTHYAFLEKLQQFIAITDNFLSDDKKN